MKREDLPDNAKRLLAAVDKHSYPEIVWWVREAIEATPKEDRKAISYVKKKSWDILVADIYSRIKSQEYSKIHELPQIFFALGNVDKARPAFNVDGIE